MRIRVLGAGIIGLACADELARRGHRVHVVDPAPGSGASHAAAGMISPAAELWHGEEALFDLGLRSLAMWPAYAARLGVPLRRTGTLLVGVDAGDAAQVRRQAALVEAHQGGAEPLDRAAARALEPGLGPRVGHAVHLPDEQSVDPRAVVRTLLERVGSRYGAGAPTRSTSRSTSFDLTVVATGTTLPGRHAGLVRGVRGEIIRGRMAEPPAMTVRGWVRGEPVYVLGRDDGEVVVGATSEEHDEPPVPTIGGVGRLVAAARELLPGIDRATFTEAIARDRPATADQLPLIGPAPGEDDVVLAAGHFRHGVLLAPLTAQLVADYVEHGSVEPSVDPRRFEDFSDEPGRAPEEARSW